MADVYGNQTLLGSLISSHKTSHGCYDGEAGSTFFVVTLTIACIGLPLTIMAIIALCSLVQKDHVVPIYVINLLVTNLIQLCCLTVLVAVSDWRICDVFVYINHVSTMVNICFMVVISLERYLIVAWPLWYRFRRNIRTSVIICVVIWLLPLFYVPVIFFARNYTETAVASFLLLPFPLFCFFLVGTVKALSAAISVPTDEKQRVVAVLVLVLLIYTLLFLPRIIYSLAKKYRHHPTFETVTIIPVYFSPLADLFLYVFMRKGVCDRLLAALCCCKVDQNMSQSNEKDDTWGADNPAHVKEAEIKV